MAGESSCREGLYVDRSSRYRATQLLEWNPTLRRSVFRFLNTGATAMFKMLNRAITKGFQSDLSLERTSQRVRFCGF